DRILGIWIVDDNILALNPPELAQPLPERVEQGRPIGTGREAKKTYPRHLSRLLRLCGARPGEDAPTEHGDERSPVHHWMISSICASNAGEIVNPSACAVFRLITAWSVVGCWTGRSAGLAPLMILST